MERFFALVKSHLYPDTPEKMHVRIIPSTEALAKGQFTYAIPEHEAGTYEDTGNGGRSAEDMWKESIVERCFRSEEDIHVIKCFVSVSLLTFAL